MERERETAAKKEKTKATVNRQHSIGSNSHHSRATANMYMCVFIYHNRDNYNYLQPHSANGFFPSRHT